MSGTTCTPSFTQESYELPQRRRSSQIAPDEIVPDERTQAEACKLLDFDSYSFSDIIETPYRPQKSFERLRRSISNLQDLIVVMSECSADSILCRFRPRSKRLTDVAVKDLSGATQPKKRREMIAEKIAARQKEKEEKKELELRIRREKLELEILDEVAIARMKNWSWPQADSSSTAADSSMSYEGEWYSEHDSD